MKLDLSRAIQLMPEGHADLSAEEMRHLQRLSYAAFEACYPDIKIQRDNAGIAVPEVYEYALAKIALGYYKMAWSGRNPGAPRLKTNISDEQIDALLDEGVIAFEFECVA